MPDYRQLFVDSGIAVGGSGNSWNTAYRNLTDLCASLSGNRDYVQVFSRGTFRENIKIHNAQNVFWIGDSDSSNPTILRGSLTSNNWTDLGGNVYGLTGVTYAPSAVVYDYKQDSITGTNTGIVLPPERAIDGRGIFYGHLKWTSHGATPAAGEWSYTPSSQTIKISPFSAPADGLTSVKNLTEYCRGYNNTGGFDSATDYYLNGLEAIECVGCTFSGLRSYLWTCPSPPGKQIGHGLHGSGCTNTTFANSIVVDCGYRSAAFSGVSTMNNSLSNIHTYGGTITGASAPTSTSFEVIYHVFYTTIDGTTSNSRGYNLVIDHYPWIMGNGKPITPTGSNVNASLHFSHSSSSTGGSVMGTSVPALGDIKYYGCEFYSHEKEINERWYGFGNTGYESFICVGNASNVPTFTPSDPSSYPLQYYYCKFDSPTFVAPQSSRQVNASFYNCKFESKSYGNYRVTSTARNTDLFSVTVTGNAYLQNCVIDFDVYTSVVSGTRGLFKVFGGANLYLDLNTLHSGSTGATQSQVSYLISGANTSTNYIQARGNIFSKNGPTTSGLNPFTRDFNSANNTSHKFGWNYFWHRGLSSGASQFNSNTSPGNATGFHATYGISGATNALYVNPGIDVVNNVIVPMITGHAYTNRSSFSLTNSSIYALTGATSLTSVDGYLYNGMPGAYGLTGLTSDITPNNSWNFYVTENSKPSWLPPHLKSLCVATQRGWEIPLLGQPEGQMELIASIPGLLNNILSAYRIEAPDISVKSLTFANAGTYYSCQIDVSDIRGRNTEYGSLRLRASLPTWLTFTTPFKQKNSDNIFDLSERGSYYAILGGTAPSVAGNHTVSLTASNYYTDSGLTFAIQVI